MRKYLCINKIKTKTMNTLDIIELIAKVKKEKNTKANAI